MPHCCHKMLESSEQSSGVVACSIPSALSVSAEELHLPLIAVATFSGTAEVDDLSSLPCLQAFARQISGGFS